MTAVVPQPRRWNTPYVRGAAAHQLDTYDDEADYTDGLVDVDDAAGTYSDSPPLVDADDTGNAVAAVYHGYSPAPQLRRTRTYANDGLLARDWYSNDAWAAQPLHTPARSRAATHATLDALLAIPRFHPWMVILSLVAVVIIGGVASTGQLFAGQDDSAAFTRYWNVGGVVDISQSAVDTAQKVVASVPGAHSIIGGPSISPDKIDAVLRSYNSPATGSGKALYDLGVKYGIDPAYALAFFIHESTAGTRGVAATSKSLGNIRWTAGCGFADYQGYRAYPTWEAGAEDWYKLIKNTYVGGWNLATVEKIIPVYAPSADHNDPTAYINGVTGLVDGWRAGN